MELEDFMLPFYSYYSPSLVPTDPAAKPGLLAVTSSCSLLLYVFSSNENPL